MNMDYEIILRDKTQIRITEKDYNNISQFLGKLKLFRLENREIVNAVDISRISPLRKQQVIRKEFRLQEPKFEDREKRVNVPGGWQKPKMRERMIRLFEQMKTQGCFKDFKDYFDWEINNYQKFLK